MHSDYLSLWLHFGVHNVAISPPDTVHDWCTCCVLVWAKKFSGDTQCLYVWKFHTEPSFSLVMTRSNMGVMRCRENSDKQAVIRLLLWDSDSVCGTQLRNLFSFHAWFRWSLIFIRNLERFCKLLPPVAAILRYKRIQSLIIEELWALIAELMTQEPISDLNYWNQYLGMRFFTTVSPKEWHVRRIYSAATSPP